MKNNRNKKTILYRPAAPKVTKAVRIGSDVLVISRLCASCFIDSAPSAEICRRHKGTVEQR